MNKMNVSRMFFVSLMICTLQQLNAQNAPTAVSWKKIIQITHMVQKNSKKRLTSLSEFLARLPLYAGYHSTQEDKDCAYEKIAELELQKVDLITDYTVSMGNPDLNVQEKKKMKRIYDRSIQELDDEIKQQKCITGDEWTDARVNAWRIAALASAAAAVGLGVYCGIPSALITEIQKLELKKIDTLDTPIVEEQGTVEGSCLEEKRVVTEQVTEDIQEDVLPSKEQGQLQEEIVVVEEVTTQDVVPVAEADIVIPVQEGLDKAEQVEIVVVIEETEDVMAIRLECERRIAEQAAQQKAEQKKLIEEKHIAEAIAQQTITENTSLKVELDIIKAAEEVKKTELLKKVARFEETKEKIACMPDNNFNTPFKKNMLERLDALTDSAKLELFDNEGEAYVNLRRAAQQKAVEESGRLHQQAQREEIKETGKVAVKNLVEGVQKLWRDSQPTIKKIKETGAAAGKTFAAGCEYFVE